MRIVTTILILILFSCNSENETIFFEISEDVFDVTYLEQSINISISSNTDWEVINIPDWISLPSKSGNENLNLELRLSSNNVEINGIFQSRTAEILFIANNQTYLLKITQGSLADIYLTTTSSHSYNLNSNQQTITLELSSNEVWNLLHTPDWVDVSLESGNGEMINVVLTISENTTHTEREGVVSFGIVEPHWQTFYIRQTGIPIPVYWEIITDDYWGLSSTSRDVNFVFDNNGNPFVGYTTSQIGGDAGFNKYIGNNWSSLGTFEGYNVKTIFNQNNTPFVFYRETSLGSGGFPEYASLKRYNGSSWEVILQNFSPGTVNYMDVIADSIGNFYITYSDSSNSGKIIVQKYDGNSITTVGQSGFSVGAVKNCQIALDINGELVVSYIEIGLNNKVAVKKFNGLDWVSIGQGVISDGEASEINLQVNSEIIVAYKDIQNSNGITVKKYSNGVWETIGSNITLNNEITTLSLAVHNDIYYIAYIKSSDKKISVKKYTNSEWQDIGEIPNDIISTGNNLEANEVKLDINPTGIPYVTFIDRFDGRVFVIKHLN
ncbi:BACON domain-containing protein [Polaribacter aestuariivivens]|uniref:BACON domain-containing protein n=1 Tax=Polaribacter aestuariivivens TaxID=2304626 RepID=UPI003F498ED5